MNINWKLFPIKMHYFFFMAASGPMLPYLMVYGKQLGISEVVMGSITGALPILFLLAKPFFGFLADYFIHQRKLIFMALILSIGIFYVSLYFIPPVPHQGRPVTMTDPELGRCNNSSKEHQCLFRAQQPSTQQVCLPGTMIPECVSKAMKNCTVMCIPPADTSTLYKSFTFYGFVTFMSLSMIAFNVANSISDAICFDILGDEGQSSYGRQRVWGAIGFGITALLGGLGMDFYSEQDIKNYITAFVLVLVFTLIDLFCCTKLKLPKMMSSENILRDVRQLLRHRRIIVFLCFTTLAGILDSFIIYFLFWFLEDLAAETQEFSKIKMLEGLTVAAETLGGEIVFFPLSGKIIHKIGYSHCFTICFLNYAFRLALISLIPSPWWILSIELFMQGPTYALMYSVIVAYANEVSPPGTTATMQGLVAGMDDGLGYAIGSVIGGFLYEAVGGRIAFRYYSALSVICCFSHFMISRYYFGKWDKPGNIPKEMYSINIPQTVKATEEESKL